MQHPAPPPAVPDPDAIAEAAGLLEASEAARVHAYAPYSNFTVGAAIRAASGSIYAGANVENAAYPVGTCAEAGAIAAMIAAGDRRIVAVVVSGAGVTPITPCGACRQRLREFAGVDTPIFAGGPGGITARYTLGMLLPEAFCPDDLAAAG